METADFVFKIIIVGDTGVGKSNLLLRYKNNSFDPFIKNTIGVDFFQVDKVVNGGFNVIFFSFE